MRDTLAAILAGVVLTGSALILAQAPRSIEVELKAAQHKEEVEGDLRGAIALYRSVAERAGRTDRRVAATALLRMADAYRKLGDAQARAVYERVTREFADQVESASAARQQLAALGALSTFGVQPTVRRIPNSAGMSDGSAPSPDGRFLSFTDASGNVSLHDLATGASRRLTHTADWGANGYSNVPVVSPDGGQVAYVWYVHPESAVEIRVISTDATPAAHKVALRTSINEVPYKLVWMPEGRQLQTIRRLPDRTSQIGTVTIENRTFRSIKSLEWRQPNMLSLAPDGRYLAYDVPATDAGSPRDIIVLATDGSQETTVVRNPANDSFPMWSRDGSHLLFLSDRTGRNGLWMVPILKGREAGPAILLRADVGPISPLGLTRGGTMLYVEPEPARSNIYLAEVDNLRATKAPVPITERLINFNHGSTWSHDGESLAYYSFLQLSADTRTGVLVVRSTRTGDERTLPLPTRISSRFQAGPKWFPDNRSVLIEVGDADGPGFGFYRFAIDTGNSDSLARLPREVSSYELSADGKTIFYVLNVEDGQKVMRYSIEQRQTTELKNVTVPNGSEIVSLAVSPDGTQVALTLLGCVVEVMPAGGGPSREVFRAEKPDGSTGSLRQALAWSPDGRFLLFARGDSSLWRVPAAGGRAERVEINMRVKTPALHPDGKRLAFVGLPALLPDGRQPRASVSTLENFLPR